MDVDFLHPATATRRAPMKSLGSNEVHVWLLRPEDVSEATLLACEAILSPSELVRADSFRFERHRTESVLTRALVRTTLSRYAELTPSAWSFRLGEYGRPHPTADVGLSFSASNHPTLVACAVARHETVGLDLEPFHRAPEVLAVAETVFGPIELADLHALEGARREDRALSLWTGKEAYVKARSLGFAAPIKEIELRFDASGRHPAPSFPTGFDQPAGWAISLHDIESFRVAVCVRGAGPAPNVVFCRTALEDVPALQRGR